MTAPPVDLTALDALAEAVAKADALEAECPFNMPGYKAETCKRCRAKASDSCGASDLAAHQALRAVRNAYPALKAEIEALRGENEKMRERIRSGLLAAGAVSALPGTEAERIVAGITAALGATS